MTTSIEHAEPIPGEPDDALEALLALPASARPDAVARDLKSRSPRFAVIPPHDLADALGVPDSWKPDSDWSFVRYAPIMTLEEYAQDFDLGPEVLYLIEDLVEPHRFQRLLAMWESLPETESPGFENLRADEREALVLAIARQQLEANECNGLSCLACFLVATSSGEDLEFEGDVEDDGACIDLRTPYEQRENRFRDLTHCLTVDW